MPPNRTKWTFAAATLLALSGPALAKPDPVACPAQAKTADGAAIALSGGAIFLGDPDRQAFQTPDVESEPNVWRFDARKPGQPEAFDQRLTMRCYYGGTIGPVKAKGILDFPLPDGALRCTQYNKERKALSCE